VNRTRNPRPSGKSGLPTATLMHADEVSRPFHRDGWIYEEKYDGWRIVAYKDGTAVRLVSRAGKEHSRRFTDLNDHRHVLLPQEHQPESLQLGSR